MLVTTGCSTAQHIRRPALNTKIEPPTVEGLVSAGELSGDNDFESVDLYLSRVAANRIDSNNSPETLWWANYRRAQLWEAQDPNVSCENFAQLAQQQAFPLRDLAFLRAYSICPKNNQIPARLGKLTPNQFDPWYKTLITAVEIEQAKRKHKESKLVQLYLQKSRVSLRREEKVDWCYRALKALARSRLSRAKKSSMRAKILARVYNLSPSRRPHIDPSQYLTVANDFRFRRKFALAHHYYLAILHTRRFDVTDKLAAYRGLRLMYKIEQKQEHALTIAKQMAAYIARAYKKSKKQPDDVALYTDTTLTLARDEWTEDKNAQALRTLNIMTGQLKGHGSLVEVDWLRGRMAEEKQNFKQATQWFNRALSEPSLSESMKDRLLWYLAWDDRKAGLNDQAISVFKDLISRNENPFEHARAEFWLAKTQTMQNDTKDAKTEFSNLVQNDPYGYYGLLAARELGNPLTAGPLREPDSANSTTVDPFFDWLVSVNETRIADRYLDGKASELRKTSPHNAKKWMALLEKYSLSKNYLSMFNQLSNLAPDTRHAILENHPSLAFPMPYYETVAQSATRFGIAPELIYAIMRQESSFNPKARSQMDAFGLLQLLPQVAERTARANSIEYHHAKDLYDPQTNIPIAAAYLRELWDKFNGNVVLVIASYNARDEAIQSWLKTRYHGDTLEFIEDIPYDETRDYVKLVLRNLITYRMLNNSQDSMAFPEWALRISK